MRDHGLVNDAAVAAIHQQFAHVCRHAPRPRRRRWRAGGGGKLVLTPRLLFDEMARQGRVLHCCENLQLVRDLEGRIASRRASSMSMRPMAALPSETDLLPVLGVPLVTGAQWRRGETARQQW